MFQSHSSHKLKQWINRNKSHLWEMPTWGQVSREGILHTLSDWHAGGYTPVPLQPRQSWGGNILDIRIWRPHKMSPLMSKNTQIPRWGRPKHRLVRPVNQALEKTKTVYEKLGFCNNLTLPEEKSTSVPSHTFGRKFSTVWPRNCHQTYSSNCSNLP